MPVCDGYAKVAHLYDLFDTKKNIPFFLKYASEVTEVLDIGAGTGRIAIPIAEAGRQVFGVEPSPPMRREFLKKIEERSDLKDKITIVAADAVSFDLSRTFALAFMSGTFDHLLDYGERLRAMRNIGQHLKAGGRLVFDVFLGQMGDSPLEPAGEARTGQKICRRLISRRTLPGSITELTLVFETYAGATMIERIEQISFAGIIDRRTVHRLLSEAGFKVREEFSAYDRSRFRDGDDLLIVEAAKE